MSSLKNKNNKTSVRLVLIVAILGVFAGYYSVKLQNNASQTLAGSKVRAHFKVFKEKTEGVILPSIKVMGLNGKNLDLAQNNDQFTVLNIWATWCTPCIKELPFLQKLSDRLGGDWRVVAVSVDVKPDKIASFTAKTGAAEIANYHDANMELQKAINIIQLPVTYILDDQNTILYEIGGDAVWNDDVVVGFLESLSASKKR